MDPRTPVVVGVGQLRRRLASAEGASSPARMMADVLEAAAADAGAGRALLEAATSLRTVELLSWRYTDPPAAVAEALGIDPAEHLRSSTGGNSPVMLLNGAARAIQAGEHGVVLMAGAEAVHSRGLARRQDVRLDWEQQPDTTPACAVAGDDRPGSHAAEMAIGLLLPAQVYPIMENALRHSLGRTPAAHLDAVAGLWSRFSRVAATNPYAWQPEALSPEAIARPSDTNRLVSSPYTKLLTANIQVDQAAGAIVCSVDEAQRLGVPDDRWVFPLAGAEAHDHWFVSERADLCSSPALAACGRALADLSGHAPADARHVDLYSCFPVAVEIAAAALGLPLADLDRPLTLTGGLTFGGGPGNAYAMHGIAQVVEACRADPSSIGLSTALGWYVTKHALVLLSTTPSETPYAWRSCQREVDATPRRTVAEGYEGLATVESGTVSYSRDGEPERLLAAVLTPDGSRAWASTSDRDRTAAFEAGGVIGESVSVPLP